MSTNTKTPPPADPVSKPRALQQVLPLLPLYAFLVLVPNVTVLPWIESAYDEKRLLQLLVMLSVGAAIFLRPRTAASCGQTWSALPRSARYGIVIVIALGLVSSLAAPAPRFGLLETAHWSLLLCAVIYVAAVYKDTQGRMIPGLSTALALSVLLYCISFAVVLFAARLNEGPLEPALLLPGFYNIRFLSQYQTWTLPLLALPLMATTTCHLPAKALNRSLLAAWWCIALVCEGRGTLIGVSLGLFLTALIFRSVALAMLKEQAVAVTLGLCLYAVLFLAPGLVADEENLIASTAAQATARQEALVDSPDARRDPGETAGVDQSLLNNRGELWTRALATSRNHPWLGAGPLHYAYDPNALAAHPHNALLQWSAEWGLPATLLAVSLLTWGFWRWIQIPTGSSLPRPSAERQQTAVALTASVLAGATHSMVSGIIVMPLSQVMLVAVVGLMLGCHQSRTDPDRDTSSDSARHVRLAAGLLVLVMAGLLAPDLIAGLVGFDANVDPILAAEGPRYWKLGDFPH